MIKELTNVLHVMELIEILPPVNVKMVIMKTATKIVLNVQEPIVINVIILIFVKNVLTAISL